MSSLPASWTVPATASMSAWTAASLPALSSPTLITMSTSSAPLARASAVSATLDAVVVAPRGNPTTVQVLTPEPASPSLTRETQ